MRVGLVLAPGSSTLTPSPRRTGSIRTHRRRVGSTPPPQGGQYPYPPPQGGQYPYPPLPNGAPGYPRPPSRHRGLAIALVIGVVGLLVLVAGAGAGGLLYLRKLNNQADEITPEEQLDKDVLTALGARTTALRTKNEKAFLSAVDPTARTVLARQRLIFRNLVQYPVTDPAYRLDLGFGIASRTVTGARSYRVALVHRLGEADVEPVALGYEETWVRRGTGITMVDSVVKENVGHSSKGDNPLNVTALKVVGGGRVTVAAGPDVTAATVAKVDRLAEKAALPVLKLWGSRPGPKGFAVFLSRRTAVKTAWFGGSEIIGSSGFCVSQYAVDKRLVAAGRDPGATPPAAVADDGTLKDESLRLGGSRVVIDLSQVRDDKDLSATLRHEFTHALSVRIRAVSQSLSLDEPYPTWAEEGFASWSEEKDVPLSRSPRLNTLRYLQRKGYFTTGMPPSSRIAFYSSNKEFIGLHYAKSAMVFRYVADRWGAEKAVDLYVRIASGQKNSAQAVLGVSSASFESAWTTWLVKQVRSGR